MDNRIVGEKCEIDDQRTREFFEERVGKSLPHRYNYVIYQDSNPELALERDRYEKEKMLPFMDVRKDSRILDIGCGVGRWADAFAPLLTDGSYVGIDYSGDLLKLAVDALKEEKNCFFCHGRFQDILQVLERNKQKKEFDLILINGVLMYLNDNDLTQCLGFVNEMLVSGGKFYIKESVGISERFTLKDFYSEELSHNYNAIYRSISEYKQALDRVFSPETYESLSEGETWRKDQENRSETTSYYWIWKKR